MINRINKVYLNAYVMKAIPLTFRCGSRYNISKNVFMENPIHVGTKPPGGDLISRLEIGVTKCHPGTFRNPAPIQRD